MAESANQENSTVLAEYFSGVENDAVLVTNINAMGCPVEAFLNGIRPQQCIVNTLCLVVTILS